MPEFFIKKGLADVELKNWIEANKEEPFVRVTIEVESSHAKLRRSFHGLLNDWFNSSEWSCNGSDIRSFEKFRNYYKLSGCDNKPEYYIYKSNYFKTIEELKANIDDDFNIKNVSLEPRSWKDMTKKQKSKALNLLLTEIRLSMTNDQQVLKRVAEITGDIDMLNSINYSKNIKENT